MSVDDMIYRIGIDFIFSVFKLLEKWCAPKHFTRVFQWCSLCFVLMATESVVPDLDPFDDEWSALLPHLVH